MRLLPPANTFSIAFDTQTMIGFVVITTVKVTNEIVSMCDFRNNKYRVDMNDHPLYPAIVRYVQDNQPDVPNG